MKAQVILTPRDPQTGIAAESCRRRFRRVASDDNHHRRFGGRCFRNSNLRFHRHRDGCRPFLFRPANSLRRAQCLPPPGFDLGNSPCAFNAVSHAGLTAFLCTTNGTRAIAAAHCAQAIFAGALVNATAIAHELARTNLDTTFLCAGTDGEPAPEDILGAGAVLDALAKVHKFEGDGSTEYALNLFQKSRSNLRSALAATPGGKNVLAAGLPDDIDFAAQLDAIPVVGHVLPNPLRILRSQSAPVPSPGTSGRRLG